MDPELLNGRSMRPWQGGSKTGLKGDMMRDPILELRRDLLTLSAERTALAEANAKHESADSAARDIDAAFVEHSRKWHPAMRQLADTPATSLDGVLVKLRTLATTLIDGRDSLYSEDILLLAIADLERLSKEENATV